MQAAALFPELSSFRESYEIITPHFADTANHWSNRVVDEMERLTKKYAGGYEEYVQTKGASIAGAEA